MCIGLLRRFTPRNDVGSFSGFVCFCDRIWSIWNPRDEFQGYELMETFLDVKGMTQAELAQRLDLSPSKINDLIKGRRKISTKVARSLAKVFEVDHTVFL